MSPKTEINLVIKIGSNVLTQDNAKPDLKRMQELSRQLAYLKREGVNIVLISSGAVAFGRGEIALTEKLDPVLKKQIWASTGQVELIKTYKSFFAEEGIPVAQILVTKEDFRDRKHFLNMKNCIQGLLRQGILPIINENDTVAITELMFTDNDELASLTAAMVNAHKLILLTNVDGVYDGPPSLPEAKLIPRITKDSFSEEIQVSPIKSAFGRGGMLTKLNMAKKSANLGIEVLIANGKRDNILIDVLEKKAPHTVFEALAKKQSTKKWLAHGAEYYKGEITINEGAKEALFSEKIISILPVGITDSSGSFSKGDIISIRDEAGSKLGLGRAEYNDLQLKEKIGQKNQKAFIHYDYLYLFQHA
ncbi:glutamate 5-kinase [Mongoliibacter ruber]|uniref:Glutamate 5-kinase n=1 Tax=Mongoliibacter ruber TaxID=1750599 RepID=A0A2T0WJY6_9BACT|nr:glutamate 5-kinase [Mongoliibacter ruber]PRY87009.1 glutamate 5-kinase [Mongoliibacter ruber]